MKNHFLLYCLFLIFSLKASAQIMDWAIKPVYSDVVPMGGDLYKVKSSEGKWGIFNISERQLTVSVEYDSITALKENRALILDKTGAMLYGIVSEKGTPVAELVSSSLSPDIVVDSNYPYYSDGLLVVGAKNGSEYMYGYVDKQGKSVIPLNNYYASPFENGLAMVLSEKRTYRLINNRGVSQYQGNENIRFISNPKDGIFLLVIGNKVKKAKLQGNKFKTVQDINTGGRMVDVADATSYRNISCRGGDTFNFDGAFRYIEDGIQPDYRVSIQEESHKFKTSKQGRIYGVVYENEELLSPQFRSVKFYDDENVIVALSDGTRGLLQYNPLGSINVSGPSDVIEIVHYNRIQVPVELKCNGLMNTINKFEITSEGTTINSDGSGMFEIPFYESHETFGSVSTTNIAVDIIKDKLKLGRRVFSVKSCHTEGFKIEHVNIPPYSDMNGNATVKVKVRSLSGIPSASAKVKVNDTVQSFKGQESIVVSIPYSVPKGGTKLVNINIEVFEETCPTLKTSFSGEIQHLSRK